MPEREGINDSQDSDDLSLWTDAGTGTATAIADPTPQEPYRPPRVPHGLPHVVRFATESGPLLPWEVRSLVILVSRYGNVKGEASVAVSTLCEITNTGSKNTIEHRLQLACDVGIMRKDSGKGGQDRKSNTYVFLGEDRGWEPLPMDDRPGTNPIVALAQVRRRNEELSARNQALETELERLKAEIAQLRNGGAIGHPDVTNGEDGSPPHEATHSYEIEGPRGSPESHVAIGHSGVTNGEGEIPSEEGSHSYGIGDSELLPEGHGAIGHSGVTNGEDAGQQYLARRARVEALVLEHRAYYDRSFRSGVLSAIEYFCRSAENEAELNRQAGILRAGQDPRAQDATPPRDNQSPPPRVNPETGRREVEFCPDCNSPYTTFNGEERCPDCTHRRRRESEA